MSVIIVCAAAIAISSACWPQDVVWDTEVGFGNVYRSGQWTPISFTFTNEGPAQAGSVSVPVTVDSGSMGPGLRTNYSSPVDLPQHSRKRYTVYILARSPQEAVLSLPHKQLKKALTGTTNARGNDVLAVVIGGEQGMLQFLDRTPMASASAPQPGSDDGGMPSGGGRYGVMSGSASAIGKVVVGHAGWETLPDLWLGWEGANAAIIADAGFAQAADGSASALLHWVNVGGTIIVPGGTLASSLASSKLGPLLPMEVSGTTTLPDLSALGEWAGKPIERQPVLVADGRLRSGASVLCGTTAQPLITMRPVGAGRVIMTSFDFTAQPVKHWDGQTAMWVRVLGRAPALAGVQQNSRLDALGDIATRVPQGRLPSMWLMTGFLLSYIIVLVPVNYLVLKRLDRRELAWLTVPFIVVLFTLGAYETGYSIRGGLVILNRLGVVETEAGSGLGRGQAFLGLFSPGRRSYDIQVGDNASGVRCLDDPGAAGRTMDVVGGVRPAIPDITMNMWTTRAFGIEFLADLKNGIAGHAEFDGSTLRATYRNDTGRKFAKCLLVGGGRESAAQPLAAGQEMTTDLNPAAATPPTASPGALKGGRSRPSVGAKSVDSEEETRADRTEFGEAAFNEVLRVNGTRGTLSTGQSPCGWPHLIATCDEALVPAELSQKGATVNDRNILVVRLPVRLASARAVLVPSWLIYSRVIEQTDTGRGTGGPRPSPSAIASGGSARQTVIEFQVPPADGGIRAVGLALQRHQSMPGAPGSGYAKGMPPPPPPGGMPGAPSGYSPGAIATVSGYNFRTGQWQRMSWNGNTAVFGDPSNCMTDDGRVLLQVTAGTLDEYLPPLSLQARVVTGGGGR